MLLSTKKTVVLMMAAALGLAATVAALAGSDEPSGMRAQFTRVDFARLPFEHAIKTVRGRGERKLAVFSDPDCPYCRRLERDTLGKLDNVTVYTFLFPLDQHTDAERKATLIWCAGDRAKAWQDWMQNGELPVSSGTCVAPLAANVETGRKLGIIATPTMVTGRGELVAGAVDRETLEEKLGRPIR
jgi:thiol:disulfide interchange protein DsbC